MKSTHLRKLLRCSAGLFAAVDSKKNAMQAQVAKQLEFVPQRTLRQLEVRLGKKNLSFL
jgi:hypothetical protein